jgi:hypothetical protein
VVLPLLAVRGVNAPYQSREWHFLLSTQNAIGSPSRKKPPVGPSSGRVASQTIPAAPSSTDFQAPSGVPMSVLTKPGQAELTRKPSSASSTESIRVTALRAAFDRR